MLEAIARINAQIPAHGFNFEISADEIDRGFTKAQAGDGSWFWRKVLSLERGKLLCLFNTYSGQKAFSVFSEGEMTKADERMVKKSRKVAEGLMKADHLMVKSHVEWRMNEKPFVDRVSPYLEAKGLKTTHCLTFEHVNTNQILTWVPMMDQAGDVWNIQTIWPDGQKRFWSGGRTKELSKLIGADTAEVMIGEGFATCLAAHKAVGIQARAAMMKSNLEYCVRLELEKRDAGRIILLVDWDGETFQRTGVNPGLKEVLRLVRKYRVKFAVPFYPDEFGPDTVVQVDCADLYHEDPEKLRQALITPFNSDECAQFDQYAVKEKEVVKVEPVVEEVEVEKSLSVPLPEVAEKIDQPGTKLTYQHIIDPLFGVTWRPDYDQLSRKDLKDLGERGAVKPTMRNFKTLMDLCGATLRYNLITKDQEWFIPGERATKDNYKNAIYGRMLDLCARVDFNPSKLDHYLTYLCDQNVFNPVASWIESKPWDGRSRLEDLYKTVTCKDEKTDEKVMRLKRLVIRKWMLTALEAAYNPNGVKAAGFLVFQGPQYIGKTRWFLRLVPEELGLAVESKTLDPKDKDSVKQTVCYWLVELGELDATFRKGDVAALKGFLTRGTDMFRPAYAKSECHFPRRTVFFGSVNPKVFLVDNTGNRRFWTLAVDAVDSEHNIDTQQLWAEMLVLYRSGKERIYPTNEEMGWVNEANEAHEAMDPFEEKLLEVFDWTDLENEFSSTRIAELIGYPRPNRGDLVHITAAVKKLNGGLGSRKSNGARVMKVGRLKQRIVTERQGFSGSDQLGSI